MAELNVYLLIPDHNGDLLDSLHDQRCRVRNMQLPL
jgi:hypothetical protein